MASEKRGSLVCVGNGIRSVGQVTVEAKNHIVTADKVFYLCADPVSGEWIRRLNPTAEMLKTFYGDGKERDRTYHEMADVLVAAVKAGQRVCAVFYGHPGIFVSPTHYAIRMLRAEGYEASMQPGISAADNLYADLGVDPARNGCQMYEATYLLLTGRALDPTAYAIIWQIGCVGELGFNLSGFTGQHLPDLVDFLRVTYGDDHLVTVYEASCFPGGAHRAETVSLGDLCRAEVTPNSTLFIPPLNRAEQDEEMIRRLKLREQLSRGRATAVSAR